MQEYMLFAVPFDAHRVKPFSSDTTWSLTGVWCLPLHFPSDRIRLKIHYFFKLWQNWAIGKAEKNRADFND
jgi:hypothetical protein